MFSSSFALYAYAYQFYDTLTYFMLSINNAITEPMISVIRAVCLLKYTSTYVIVVYKYVVKANTHHAYKYKVKISASNSIHDGMANHKLVVLQLYTLLRM